MSIPLVSIVCLAYNHESYIRQCLDGFVMQKTNFKIEILISDDASTDNTAQIIKEYEQRYPDLFVTFYHKKNLYSQHIDFFFTEFMPNAKGKYIAMCEGDDYWTDPLKLQKQVDFLEGHEEYVAVAENGIIHNTINNTEHLFNDEKEHDVCIEELIIRRRFPTASVVFKRQALITALSNQHVKDTYDTLLWCLLCVEGKFRYFDRVSSVYRRGMQGTVESTDKYLWAQTVEKWNLELKRLLCPKYVPISIIKKNIWQHYFMVYRCQKSKRKIALQKMFLYANPFKTATSICYFYILKLLKWILN